MNKIILSLFILSITLNSFAQETDSLKLKLAKEETVLNKELSLDTNNTTDIKFKNKTITIVKDDDGETTITVKKTGNIDEQKNTEASEAFETIEELNNFDDFDIDINKKKHKSNFKGSWAAVEFGVNNYFNNDFSISRDASDEFMDLNTGKSWNFNLNFAQYSINLINEQFGIVTGLGLEFNNYRFDNNITIQKVGGVIVEDATTYAGFNLDKTKLTTTYLTAPILLELHIPIKHDEFKISGGVIGGVKIGSHTKVVYKDSGNKKKDKIKDDFNLSSLRYGFTARLGFEDVNLYANYYMTSLFEKNKGPELYPFAVGISLAF